MMDINFWNKKDFNEKIGDNFHKYLYEFVTTSNATYKLGKDQLIFLE